MREIEHVGAFVVGFPQAAACGFVVILRQLRVENPTLWRLVPEEVEHESRLISPGISLHLRERFG